MNDNQLTHIDMMKVYEWVDSMDLSKRKKNIRRDFSDGVLMSEILKINYPLLVNPNNYAETYSVKKKIYNWTTLNEKVLKKLQMSLSNEEIVALANSEKGVIEKVLMQAYHVIHNQYNHNDNKKEMPLLQNNVFNQKEYPNKTKKDIPNYKSIIFQKEMEINGLKKKLNLLDNQITQKELENKNLIFKINSGI